MHFMPYCNSERWSHKGTRFSTLSLRFVSIDFSFLKFISWTLLNIEHMPRLTIIKRNNEIGRIKINCLTCRIVYCVCAPVFEYSHQMAFSVWIEWFRFHFNCSICVCCWCIRHQLDPHCQRVLSLYLFLFQDFFNNNWEIQWNRDCH